MTLDPAMVDARFAEAVGAMDAGDVARLERMLEENPWLVSARLEEPGAWLRDAVGDAVALSGFFARPYLLWFVAEDPERRGVLPANIVDIARTMIAALRRAGVASQQEQLDYALRLVAWSPAAARAGVQLDLLDVLLDAGASAHGVADDALVNGHEAAARHLLERGAAPSLATALCLERWDDAERLVAGADARAKQMALTLCALRGKASAIERLLRWGGVDMNRPSADLYSHATPLHHAVSSGSLDAVRVLVEAGARLDDTDSVYGGTPLDWAEYGAASQSDPETVRKYGEITSYLRSRPR